MLDGVWDTNRGLKEKKLSDLKQWHVRNVPVASQSNVVEYSKDDKF